MLHLVKPREATSSTDALSSETDCSNDEDDLQIQSLLAQSRKHLEQTQALRVRSHLLRAEDYVSPFVTVTRGILSLVKVLFWADKWWPSVSGRDEEGVLPRAICRPLFGVVVLLSVISLLRRWLAER